MAPFCSLGGTGRRLEGSKIDLILVSWPTGCNRPSRNDDISWELNNRTSTGRWSNYNWPEMTQTTQQNTFQFSSVGLDLHFNSAFFLTFIFRSLLWVFFSRGSPPSANVSMSGQCHQGIVGQDLVPITSWINSLIKQLTPLNQTHGTCWSVTTFLVDGMSPATGQCVGFCVRILALNMQTSWQCINHHTPPSPTSLPTL